MKKTGIFILFFSVALLLSACVWNEKMVVNGKTVRFNQTLVEGLEQAKEVSKEQMEYEADWVVDAKETGNGSYEIWEKEAHYFVRKSDKKDLFDIKEKTSLHQVITEQIQEYERANVLSFDDFKKTLAEQVDKKVKTKKTDDAKVITLFVEKEKIMVYEANNIAGVERLKRNIEKSLMKEELAVIPTSYELKNLVVLYEPSSEKKIISEAMDEVVALMLEEKE